MHDVTKNYKPISEFDHPQEKPMTDLSQQVHLSQQKIILTDAERQPCEIWTRVMGYHRPMASFNTGKKGEFHERLYFNEKRLAVQPAA